ncbi:MAG: HEAT repeat domain-containing protein, partial [Verrucomicrobiota bacterium]
MIKRILLLSTCLIASHVSALDQNLITQQLDSQDYSARQQARLDLKAALSEATAPGAAADKLESLQNFLIAESGGDLPLPERLYLIRMLELFGNAAAIEPLAELLDAEEVEVQDSAIRALASVPGEEATRVLTDGLKTGNDNQRIKYIKALAYRGSSDSAPKIAESLESENPQVVLSVLDALIRIDNANVAPALESAADSAPDELKPVIEAALLDLNPDGTTVDRLLDSGSNAGVRMAAFQHVLSHDASKAEAHILKVLQDPDAPARSRLID